MLLRSLSQLSPRDEYNFDFLVSIFILLSDFLVPAQSGSHTPFYGFFSFLEIVPEGFHTLHSIPSITAGIRHKTIQPIFINNFTPNDVKTKSNTFIL